MSEKIKLGTVKPEISDSQTYNSSKDSLFILGENISIKHHNWDCKWYWGFGYIGNRNLHTHAAIFTKELLWHNVNDVFVDSIFKSDDNFWVFKDLLIQAYALKKCAEIYNYGGHCYKKEGITDIILSEKKEKQINKDLEKILDTLWNFLKRLSEET